jgi:hypothetical protein
MRWTGSRLALYLLLTLFPDPVFENSRFLLTISHSIFASRSNHG